MPTVVMISRSLLMSFGMGLVVGALYAVSHVRSPAPPIVALIGLLGMVVGEWGADAIAASLLSRR